MITTKLSLIMLIYVQHICSEGASGPTCDSQTSSPTVSICQLCNTSDTALAAYLNNRPGEIQKGIVVH